MADKETNDPKGPPLVVDPVLIALGKIRGQLDDVMEMIKAEKERGQ